MRTQSLSVKYIQRTEGFTLAKWLYDNGVRDSVIFITGYAEYALAGYDIHPLHFLMKPADDAVLTKYPKKSPLTCG